MSSIALLLSGVLQSWGTTTIGHARATNRYPTKSAIVGLVANAMGRERDDDISDLAALSLAVRIDSPGVVQRDYHTVNILVKPSKGEWSPRTTERFYLADAVFVTTLSHHDEKLLDSIESALAKPERPLFLGRKSCIPSRRILFDRYESDFVTTLGDIPWQADATITDSYFDASVELEVFRDALDDLEGFDSDVVMDYPLTFDSEGRRYASRGVYRSSVVIPTSTKKEVRPTSAFALASSLAGGL